MPPERSPEDHPATMPRLALLACLAFVLLASHCRGKRGSPRPGRFSSQTPPRPFQAGGSAWRRMGRGHCSLHLQNKGGGEGGRESRWQEAAGDVSKEERCRGSDPGRVPHPWRA